MAKFSITSRIYRSLNSKFLLSLWINIVSSLCFRAYFYVKTLWFTNSDWPAKYSRRFNFARLQKRLHISGIDVILTLSFEHMMLHICAMYAFQVNILLQTKYVMTNKV